MQFGQGSRMALPICGIYLQKVYSSGNGLSYSSGRTFDLPEGYNPCSGLVSQGDLSGNYSIDRF